MQKALYVGAGTDVSPCLAFPFISNFIFVDQMYSTRFIDDVSSRLYALGFESLSTISKIELLPRRRVFYHNKFKQRLEYWFGLFIDEATLPGFAPYIHDVDLLILIGTINPVGLLHHIKTPKFDVLLSNTTVYLSSQEDSYQEEDIFHPDHRDEIFSRLDAIYLLNLEAFRKIDLFYLFTRADSVQMKRLSKIPDHETIKNMIW